MRLFAVPILANRWAYYCHSTVPSKSYIGKAVEWSSKKWDALGAADPSTWKNKLYVRGCHLMNQMDYEEWFLKGVPTKEDMDAPLDKAYLYHPALIDASSLQSDFNTFLKTREPYHKKYMYYSAYWVPIACTFVIVPAIPNIPLAYNLFRLYSHFKAYKGAQHLLSLVERNTLEYAVSPKMDVLLKDTKFATAETIDFPEAIVKAFEVSKKPKLHVLEKDIPGTLQLDVITEIARQMDIPGIEVELRRARFQILARLAKERFGSK